MWPCRWNGNGIATVEMVGWFLKNLKEKPHDPAIPLLGTHPKELKTLYSNTYTPMFTNALFIKSQKVENNQMFRNR